MLLVKRSAASPQSMSTERGATVADVPDWVWKISDVVRLLYLL